MGSRACGMGPPKSTRARASAHVRFRPGPRRDLHRACIAACTDSAHPEPRIEPINTHRCPIGRAHPTEITTNARTVRRHPRRLHGPHRRGHRLPGRHLIDRGHRGRHERARSSTTPAGASASRGSGSCCSRSSCSCASACSRSRSAADGAGRWGPGYGPGRWAHGTPPTAATRAASGSRTPIAGSTRRRRGTPARRPIRRRHPAPEPVRPAPAHGRLTPSPTTPGGYPRPASRRPRSCLPDAHHPRRRGRAPDRRARPRLPRARGLRRARRRGRRRGARDVPRPASRRARPGPRPAARRRPRRRAGDPPRLHASRS